MMTLEKIVGGVRYCRAESDREVIAWVLTIARNTIIDFMRHLARIPTGESALLDFVVDDREVGKGNDALQALHDALPETAQTILFLRLIERRPWNEIAREVGLTTSATKRRFQRLIADLRIRLVGKDN